MPSIYALFVALALTPSSLAAPTLSKISARVAGGSISEPGQFPFVVATQDNGEQLCGGTLLNAYTVLTAAHCSFNKLPQNVTVRAGSTLWHSGGVLSNISEIKIHPQYRPVMGQYDVSVWHLATPIQPSDTIGYAKIAGQGHDPPVGLQATTAGWGDKSQDRTVPGSEELRFVNVPVVSRQACSIYGQISSLDLCAGGEEGKGSCPMDSGGPIWNAQTREIIGTVHSGGGCGLKDVPIMYTNLGGMSDWVIRNSWSA
ncbi:hypothetical protein VTL71DRAFT_12000 [Oculimacula yallundae]|uniref:Peptidase S1 domain-containing protein n=1 Tax=Oculimacula yallundae TaxID=86028 RepID=A0ABR4CSA7_9HELO